MFGLTVVALLRAEPVFSKEWVGRVVHVSDGDTIQVIDADKRLEKVRLLGIDAPERKQAFGTKSKDALASRVLGQTVLVEYEKRDRFGRLLGKVQIGVRDINREMIETGLAWHYKQFARNQPVSERQAYENAQRRAQEGLIGLWADAHPTAPWEFRKLSKRRPASRHSQSSFKVW